MIRFRYSVYNRFLRRVDTSLLHSTVFSGDFAILFSARCKSRALQRMYVLSLEWIIFRTYLAERKKRHSSSWVVGLNSYRNFGIYKRPPLVSTGGRCDVQKTVTQKNVNQRSEEEWQKTRPAEKLKQKDEASAYGTTLCFGLVFSTCWDVFTSMYRMRHLNLLNDRAHLLLAINKAPYIMFLETPDRTPSLSSPTPL